VKVVRNFMQLLKAKWGERKFVCVGLDSDAGKLPVRYLGLRDVKGLLAAQQHFVEYQKYLDNPKKYLVAVPPLTAKERRLLSRAQLAFNMRIVNATKDIVCAYKPNAAFYEALGDAGWWSLQKTILYINKVAPDVPVILDCKRGDIGNTNRGYVMASVLADAVTVHPYLGEEAMKPFLDQENKGVIVLVRTSNPGAGEFQDLEVVIFRDGEGRTRTLTLYQKVAHNVVGSWNYNGNCAVVAGATYPEEITEVRQIIGGDMPILIPGFGKQGGERRAAVLAGINSRGQGIIANNSSAILFASGGPNFAEAARDATRDMHDNIVADITST
jgi:orotidine-5'-phosphate decarboxylase